VGDAGDEAINNLRHAISIKGVEHRKSKRLHVNATRIGWYENSLGVQTESSDAEKSRFPVGGPEHERETAAARGTGEGHYAWDLGANNSMTNANVDTVVESTSGRDLKLSYKGGSNSITVPANVPVVTLAPATRADLIVASAVAVKIGSPRPCCAP
jgi:hypothetical protein